MARCLLMLVACCVVLFAAVADAETRIYVGTYTSGVSEGIYVLDLAPDGSLQAPRLAAKTSNPSFLAVHPTRPVLYAVGEGAGPEGGADRVRAYSIEPAGSLAALSNHSAEGQGACHVAVSPEGGQLAIAHYGSGSVCGIALNGEGRLMDTDFLKRHSGSSVNASRQEAPHAHNVLYAPGAKLLYVADLGLDKVLAYSLDKPVKPVAEAALPPGAGPRHLALHPNGRYLYCVNELNSTITCFEKREGSAEMKAIQNITTLPEDYKGENYPAEIAVHPSGAFVYASNRGHDSIASFAVDAATGKLMALAHSSTGGAWPRHFMVTAKGDFLLVANQKSDNIVSFRIDTKSGIPSTTGHSVGVPSPVCLVQVERDHTGS